MRWVGLVLSFCLLTSDAVPLVVLYIPVGGGVTRLGGGVIRLLGGATRPGGGVIRLLGGATRPGGGVIRLLKGVPRLVRGVRMIRVVFRVGSFLRRFALASTVLGLTRRVSLLAPIFMMHRELKTPRGDLRCPEKPLGCNSHDIVVKNNSDRGFLITVNL